MEKYLPPWKKVTLPGIVKGIRVDIRTDITESDV